VVSKVTLGEADAGIVYATDARAAGDKAQGITVADEHNVVAAYPVGLLDQAGNAPAARAFRAFLLSPAGQQALVASGFLPA
jgi:molybdate transport system substrate-binding protein